MRILILGAAGRAGREVLSFLGLLPDVQGVILADGDAEELSKMASRRAPFPLHLRYLDASDPRSLLERLSEADLVVGCLGPSHRHEMEVFRAVLEVGCDYLSLCDDAASTREILSRGEAAAARGCRVLLGCGMAPGLSNLMAVRAASRLDRAERLAFYWRLDALFSLGGGTLRQLAHSLSGRATITRKGSEERVRAGSRPEEVDFPPPAGPTLLVHLDRPEPLTVPRAVHGVRESFFKAGMGRRSEDFLLQVLSRLEEGYAELALNLVRLSGGRSTVMRRNAPCPASLRVTVEGRRGGEPRSLHLAVNGDYYRVTGAVAVAAVAWMRDEGPPPGVHTPEVVLDAGRLLPFLAASGARFFLSEGGPMQREDRRAGHMRYARSRLL